MASVGEMKAKVLNVLQKTPGYQGAYTDEKVLDAIQDSIDYASMQLIDGAKGSWRVTIRHLNTVAGDSTVQLPRDFIIIREIRYLIGQFYIPIPYDEGVEQVNYDQNTSFNMYPNRYRIVDDLIYFNPAPSTGGEKYIEIEGYTLPPLLAEDSQEITLGFNRAVLNFVKWRAASLLALSRGKAEPEWTRMETEWRSELLKMASKRIQSTTYIREFNG